MNSPPTNELGSMSIQAPSTSPIFNDSTADVTFKSSDNMLFRTCRKYLDASTGGFPPSEFAHVEGENIPLCEDSATLEVLFQFMRPKRHPTLAAETIEFDLLEKVAEAAEKYEVFAALNICFIRMEQALPTHPVEVLNYGAKHEYPTLIDKATPYLLDLPLENVVQLLSQNLVIRWVRYRSRWSNAVINFLWRPIEGTQYVSGYKKMCRHGCLHGGGLIADLWQILGERRSRNAVIAAYAALKAPCSHVSIDVTAIGEQLDGELATIGPFVV